MRRRVLLPAAVAAGLLFLAGCGDDSARRPPPDDVTDPWGRKALDHIHALGMTGDQLYAATHYGLFIVGPDGRAAAASDDDHDLMGFTIADTGEFLASGHPNSSNDLPPNLGLLQSSDDGATWRSLSLSGKVDFHAIDAKDGHVYGYDSGTGQLLVSTDRREWDSLGRVPLADMAIKPGDGATLLVTSEPGPQLSTDGGQTFTDVDGAPPLMLVDWPHPDQLYGITPDGVVHHSTDGGATWDERSKIGERPQAMTVTPDGRVYAALEGSIVVSSDGGDTFTQYYATD